jgi:hypothetical protein
VPAESHTSLITPYSLTESSPHCRSSIRKPYTRHAPLHPVPRTVHIMASVIRQDKVALDRHATRAAGILEKQDIHSALLGRAPRTHNRTARPALRRLHHAEAAQVDCAHTRATLPLPQQAQSCILQPLNKAPPAMTTLTTPPPSVAGTRSHFPFFYVCRRASQRERTASRVLCSRLPRCCWGDIPATQRPRACARASHGYLRGVP